jgi:hypothetical protein
MRFRYRASWFYPRVMTSRHAKAETPDACKHPEMFSQVTSLLFGLFETLAARGFGRVELLHTRLELREKRKAIKLATVKNAHGLLIVLTAQ